MQQNITHSLNPFSYYKAPKTNKFLNTEKLENHVFQHFFILFRSSLYLKNRYGMNYVLPIYHVTP